MIVQCYEDDMKEIIKSLSLVSIIIIIYIIDLNVVFIAHPSFSLACPVMIMITVL